MFRLFIAALISTLSLSVVIRKTRVPPGWRAAERSFDDSKEFILKFALKPNNAQVLEQSLIEIATPGSKKFRQYMKKEDVAALVGRSDADIERLRNFLKPFQGTVTSVNDYKDWAYVTLTARAIENLFRCRLATFYNAAQNRYRVVAADTYTIPDEIADILDLVSGLNSFPAVHWSAAQVAMSPSLRTADSTPAAITPKTIYDVYKLNSSKTSGAKLSSQAVVEFGKNNFHNSDLQSFFKQFQPSLQGQTVGVVYGSNSETGPPSTEANLDVQYIMATGVYINTSDYVITANQKGESIEDEFLDYTLIVLSESHPPLSHSISYGEYGGSYDNATDQRFSYELQLMGVAGISVSLASGDNGVGCNSDGTSQEFDYPSSPYITMVGATYLDSKTNQEIGATLSSGGFSKDFMQASWQAKAVNAYLNSGVALPKQAYYAPGRAYPDVAAFGQNVQVVSNGKTQGVSGTSCSAPIFAGIIALINAQLLAAGKPPLGFLNPWLYANPQMFTDITKGSNPYEKCQGFLAAPGWDPVTGMGTPLYPQMLTAAFK